ncbi:Protein interacting with poly(A)-binding protein [Actinomyces bovis]|uniref:Protein interacting with poly(A)-binding protein n=1 Tax=Actinomyces bovis TaxID=1658 RepID=A0ABY1VN65_9ACTO|nr:hypothetical protein [Actinomyces bovis]SPT53551.1 Protein interacting with poly(A)-binding protein [Actinomyces bovis]VEG55523.1 Protein interacting with poly(A)-binding protein [Actinomyces israelii]
MRKTSPSRPLLRRLATAALLPALALGLAVGSGSTAAADGLGTGSADIEIVIHKNDTLDLSAKIKVGGIDPSVYCNKDKGDDDLETTIEVVDDACVRKARGVSLSKIPNGSKTKIRHEDGKFYFKMQGSNVSPGSGVGSGGFSSKLTVVFPGKVSTASAGGTIDGNTVTWTNPDSSEELTAEASDSSSNFLLWLILGLVLLLLIGGGIITAVLLSSRKKKQAAMAGGYPMPGSQVPAQGGYAPVQPQPYQQPGMAPQVPQQAPQPGQPFPQPGYAAQPPAASQDPAAGQPFPQPGYGQPGGQPPQNPNAGY